MATSHLMTGTYVPRFGPNSFIFILAFGEIFSYFATAWKWYCMTRWIHKKSRLFRRFFQYSVICHFSKYIKLTLTGFNKIGYFIGIVCNVQNDSFFLFARKNEKEEEKEKLLIVLMQYSVLFHCLLKMMVTWLIMWQMLRLPDTL